MEAKYKVLGPGLSDRCQQFAHFHAKILFGDCARRRQLTSCTNTSVGREQAGEFLAAARKIIRKHNEDLLNITVRDVKTDHDTFLNYATQDMLAFVMFFSQPRTPAGDSEMQTMTRELVDAVLEAGGRYYLPYRLHPTAAQFRPHIPRPTSSST